jgi:predicted ATPase
MTNSDQGLPAGREYIFEPFRFVPSQQLLLHHNTPVRIGGRSLDILAELVKRPGELVSKRELIERVWPQFVVAESNLKVHVAALRRALGEGGREARYIATVAGRGYRFVAPLTQKIRESPSQPDLLMWERMRKLPAAATQTTGRAETIAALRCTLQQRRFVTIVGPGGIGKSTVALAVAETFIAQAGVEICFVGLSPLSEEKFVVGAVATALGMTIHSGDGVDALITSLRERRLLLVLDNCEHVIDAVAALVDHIVNGALNVRILATSREPLRSASEYVYRLTPLAYPASWSQLTAAQALAFPSILLFTLRASECLDGYELSDVDAPAVAEICSRLEGIPMAIELAATRMDALGASALAARLGNRFELLKRGRRGALQRHKTITASLDWSYELLPDQERTILRSLSVFTGAFTLEAAAGLCQDERNNAQAIVEGVANLVDKSLLTADVSNPCVHYRLLDTTKAYALEKLDECGETDAMRRRHLAYHQAIFERATGAWDALSDIDWLAQYGRYLDDVRAALAWAFSPSGSPTLGIALTVAAIPLWMQLSLLEECHQCVERALAIAEDGVRPNAQQELLLCAAAGAAALYASGPVPASELAWRRALKLADTQQNSEYQLMALWGIAVCRCYAGELQAVLELAERFQRLASAAGSGTVPSGMDRLIATALHYSGDQPAAGSRLRALLKNYTPPLHSSRLTRYQLNHRSATLSTLANVLWLQGFPDQAAEVVREALQQARNARHAPSVMFAITNAAFPVMVQIGDYVAADALLAELASYQQKHAFTLWDNLWSCLHATLQVLRGEAGAIPPLQRAVAKLQAVSHHPGLPSYLGTLAAALGAQGQAEASLATIDEALAFCEAGEERCYYAELLRIKGTLLQANNPAAATQCYEQARAVAISQGALAWQLRAVMSHTRMKIDEGGGQAERRMLQDVYHTFSEGFDSVDLREAQRLLNPEA